MKHKLNITASIISIVLTSILLGNTVVFYPLIFLFSASFIVFLVVGILDMRFDYFLKTTTSNQREFCLLTFDDGPHPFHTPKILNILAKHDIKAIFFLIGKNVEKYPELTRKIRDEGHPIGNHTNYHNPITPLFSRRRLRTEISKAQEVFERVLNINVTMFRPPIGYTNPKYASILKELDLQCVGWSLRSYDSVYKDPVKLKERLLSKIKHKQIVLMHDNMEITAGILDSFIIEAKSNGIIFASDKTVKSIIND